MKMKSLLSWLLVLILCFTMTACQSPETPELDNTIDSTSTEATEATESTEEITDLPETGAATPLLYRVTDENGNVIWLFGSIHVGREDYYPLPDYVLNAFDGAESLAVEMDIIAFEKNLGLQTQALASLVYMDGTSIQDHIPQELYTQAVAAIKDCGIYMSAFDQYRPVLWSSMIDSFMIEEMGGNPKLGIDMHLLKRAYADEKEILEVESAQFQYQMLAGFSDELQTMLLEASVESYLDPDPAKEDLQNMMDLWASGDEQAFSDYLASDGEDMTEDEKLLYAEYQQAMIIDRNLSMADYAEEALLSGKEVFICVGAAHIVGEGAMAQLLAQRGYTVECLTPQTTTSAEPVFNTENISRITFYGYYGSGSGATVPGEHITEIKNWLNSFTLGEKAPEILPPGTNTYYVEIEYTNGTIIKEGLDVITVDGTSYELNGNNPPDCFAEIISKTTPE